MNDVPRIHRIIENRFGSRTPKRRRPQQQNFLDDLAFELELEERAQQAQARARQRSVAADDADDPCDVGF